MKTQKLFFKKNHCNYNKQLKEKHEDVKNTKHGGKGSKKRRSFRTCLNSNDYQFHFKR